MRARISLRLVLAAVFGLASEAVLAETAEERLAALAEDRVAIARDFAATIVECVRQTDTGHPIFHGCIDWHSAVHGHWALVAVARVTGDDELLAAVTRRLDPRLIAIERRDLAANPGFEMPYGRAWFLRLAIEYARATGDQRLTPMADDLAASLMAYLGGRGFDPLSASYDSESWALLNLRAYAAFRGDDKTVAFVDRLVATVAPAPCRFDSDARRASFMAVCTNWAWLAGEAKAGGPGAAAMTAILSPDTLMPPVTRPASAHLFGLDFSRAWGLWRLWRRTGEPAYLAAYLAHFGTAYRQRDWWAGDYRTVAHWVPQFGVFALMPLFEPDYR